MQNCLKCGHIIEDNSGAACPKCGAVYAKVQRSRQISELSSRFEKEMELSEQAALRLRDEQREKDAISYQGAQNLSFFFFCLAACVGITELVVGFVWWDSLVALPFFSNQDKIFLAITIAIADSISILTLVAIGYFLRLAKDTADNTRATREYLAQIVHEK